MKIVLDCSAAAHQRAGIGRYAQELAGALRKIAPQQALIAFYNRAEDALLPPPLEDLPRIALPDGDKPWRLRVLLAHWLRRSQDALLPPDSLFHAADHLLPRLAAIPSVFTLYDLTHHFYPETQARLNRLYLKLMLPRFLQQAQEVIAISESTRRAAIDLYHLPPDRIQTIPLGVSSHFRPVDPAAVRAKYHLPERFMLYVGTIEPRKNLTTLLEALPSATPPAPLVIAGKRGWLAERFFAQLKARGRQEQVLLPGYIPDADLPGLYSAARLFVFPSLYEGFGLPVLEAMACGTPVVCSNTSSLPEVAAEAALLVNPRDARALRLALERLWQDDVLHAELGAAGLARAAGFSWERTAQATLAVYERSVLDRSVLDRRVRERRGRDRRGQGRGG